MDDTRIMTEKEAWDEDKRWTDHTIIPSGSKPGILTRRGLVMDDFDSETKSYLQTQSSATHKTPAQIIGELVREKLAAAV
jgi:hypothetical protein